MDSGDSSISGAGMGVCDEGHIESALGGLPLLHPGSCGVSPLWCEPAAVCEPAAGCEPAVVCELLCSVPSSIL